MEYLQELVGGSDEGGEQICANLGYLNAIFVCKIVTKMAGLMFLQYILVPFGETTKQNLPYRRIYHI